MCLALELILMEGFLRGRDIRALACVNKRLYTLAKPHIKRTNARDVIVRYLKKVDSINPLSLSFFYYRYYPTEHIHGQIQLISWKSGNDVIREKAKDLIESGIHLRKFHLAKLIAGMSEGDVAYVGW